MTTSFPKGPCSLGILCSAPTHELRKHCPGCSGWIHVVCGRVLEEDEGPFEADLVMCPGCDYMISQDKHPVVNEWKSKKQSSSSTVQDAGSKKLEQKKKKQVETEVKRKKKKQVVVGDQVSSKRQKPILTNQLINEQPNPQNQQPINQQPNQTLRKSSKNKKPPKTTGRKSATNERVKIKVRRRVKISRFQLYHLLVTDEQRKKIPKDIPNKYNFLALLFQGVRIKGLGM